MDDKLTLLKTWLDQAERLVFFGGAGVSTESGVPDFRSKDGLYNQHDVRFEGYQPEYLLSHTCLVREPAVFFEFYRQKMDARHVRPNDAHRCLARLEAEGRLSAVVTQNIDNLHQRAGSKRVYELHGSTARNYCMRCGKKYGPDHLFDCGEAVPRCGCGGIIRCDVTLYEEALPEEAVEGAVSAIADADVLMIGGTSLTVWPAASFVRYFRGKRLIVINRDPLDVGLPVPETLQINAPIGATLRAVCGNGKD
ncbi:MAG: NAD-dependent protein deacylase [Clostridia bacterium]|nr:NAD-dependent protein deacylase [Clostridia bacterium]